MTRAAAHLDRDDERVPAWWDAKTCAPLFGLKDPKSFYRLADSSATLRAGHRTRGRKRFWISTFVRQAVESPDFEPAARASA